MDSRELIEETVRLAAESVRNGWGGPFGALVVKDGEIVSRGQNRVLLTGDPTAHAEMEAIRNAVQLLHSWAPAIPEEHRSVGAPGARRASLPGLVGEAGSPSAAALA